MLLRVSFMERDCLFVGGPTLVPLRVSFIERLIVSLFRSVLSEEVLLYTHASCESMNNNYPFSVIIIYSSVIEFFLPNNYCLHLRMSVNDYFTNRDIIIQHTHTHTHTHITNIEYAHNMHRSWKGHKIFIAPKTADFMRCSDVWGITTSCSVRAYHSA